MGSRSAPGTRACFDDAETPFGIRLEEFTLAAQTAMGEA